MTAANRYLFRKVTPRSLKIAVMHTLVSMLETDKNGRLKIDGLNWESYFLFVGKESDGYPNTLFRVYRTR